MTKADLAREISEKTGITLQTATETIEQFMNVVKNSLAHGESVYLRGFGTFSTKHRAEKPARNIAKGTTIVVPAHNVPCFKAASEFKEAVRKGDAG